MNNSVAKPISLKQRTFKMEFKCSEPIFVFHFFVSRINLNNTEKLNLETYFTDKKRSYSFQRVFSTLVDEIQPIDDESVQYYAKKVIDNRHFHLTTNIHNPLKIMIFHLVKGHDVLTELTILTNIDIQKVKLPCKIYIHTKTCAQPRSK